MGVTADLAVNGNTIKIEKSAPHEIVGVQPQIENDASLGSAVRLPDDKSAPVIEPEISQ